MKLDHNTCDARGTNVILCTSLLCHVMQCVIIKLLHTHVDADVNQQLSNSLTNYCSRDSCDSGTVLHLHCKFMTKVTHSFMLILVTVHDSLLSCACMCLVMSVCECT